MTRRRALAWLVSTPLAGQMAERQKRGREVVDAAVGALGGARFRSFKDRVEHGRAYSYYRERLSGLTRATIYTRYLTPPERPDPGQLYQRERQAFGKDQDYAALFDETQGYQITFRGATPLPEATLLRYRDSARRNVFYTLKQRLSEPGLLIERVGSGVHDNQPVDIVEFTDSGNVTVKVLFHQSTHLPVRQEFVRRDPQTRERFEEVTLFSKYRDVNGIQWPWAITRFRNNEKIFDLLSESVAINQDLSDQLFTLPANMKLLSPK